MRNLADRVVALGIGEADEAGYHIADCGYSGYALTALQFNQDWRVAGALIDKVLTDSKNDFDITIERDITTNMMLCVVRGYFVRDTNGSENKNSCRVIIEACVEALEKAAEVV